MKKEERYMHDGMIRSVCALPEFRRGQYYLLENVQLQDITSKGKRVLPRAVYKEKQLCLPDYAINLCLCQGDDIHWGVQKPSREDKDDSKGAGYSVKSELCNKYIRGAPLLSMSRSFPVMNMISGIGEVMALVISRDRPDMERKYQVVTSPLSPKVLQEITSAQPPGNYVEWNPAMDTYAITPYGAFCGLRMRWDAAENGKPVGTIVAASDFAKRLESIHAWGRGRPAEADEFSLFHRQIN